VDYMDKNEEGAYEAYAKNAPMYTTEELFRVTDLAEEALLGTLEPQRLGFLPYVTVWGGSQTNINTASKYVLMSLSDRITSEIADNIISYRESQDEEGEPRNFKTIAELLQVDDFPADAFPSIAPLVTVQSKIFSGTIAATSGGLTSGARAILQRQGGDAPIKTVFLDSDIVSTPTAPK
ncbi:MAG: type II secretion system protein GspK, partial [Planctomycetota bacterium]|nr:type II secretion system protein GspK [Planctomycetota bacterium]